VKRIQATIDSARPVTSNTGDMRSPQGQSFDTFSQHLPPCQGAAENPLAEYSAALSLAAAVDQAREAQPVVPVGGPPDLAAVLRHYYQHWAICTPEQRDYYTRWAPVVFQNANGLAAPATTMMDPTLLGSSNGTAMAAPLLPPASSVGPPAAPSLPVAETSPPPTPSSTPVPTDPVAVPNQVIAAAPAPVAKPPAVPVTKVLVAAPSINMEALEARKRRALELAALMAKPKAPAPSPLVATPASKPKPPPRPEAAKPKAAPKVPPKPSPKTTPPPKPSPKPTPTPAPAPAPKPRAEMPSKADMKAWSERQATRLKAAAEAIGITDGLISPDSFAPSPPVGRSERTGPGRSGIVCSYWKAGRSCKYSRNCWNLHVDPISGLQEETAGSREERVFDSEGFQMPVPLRKPGAVSAPSTLTKPLSRDADGFPLPMPLTRPAARSDPTASAPRPTFSEAALPPSTSALEPATA